MSAPSPSRRSGEDFVLKLGRGLHTYGYPAHRLEEALGQVCHRLGLEGQFFSMPTALFASFGEGDEHRTFQIRVEPGGVDLGKLVRLDETRAQVAGGSLDPDEGSRRIEAILAAPPAYGPWLTTAAFTLASATACRFFGGGLREIAAAGVIGLVIGLLALILAERPATARVFEALAAAVAGFLAVSAAVLAPPLVASLATLGGLIILVPGYGLDRGLHRDRDPQSRLRHGPPGRRGAHVPGDRLRGGARDPDRRAAVRRRGHGQAGSSSRTGRSSLPL